MFCRGTRIRLAPCPDSLRGADGVLVSVIACARSIPVNGVWAPLAEVPSLALWANELKSLAIAICAGSAADGAHSLCRGAGRPVVRQRPWRGADVGDHELQVAGHPVTMSSDRQPATVHWRHG